MTEIARCSNLSAPAATAAEHLAATLRHVARELGWSTQFGHDEGALDAAAPAWVLAWCLSKISYQYRIGAEGSDWDLLMLRRLADALEVPPKDPSADDVEFLQA